MSVVFCGGQSHGDYKMQEVSLEGKNDLFADSAMQNPNLGSERDQIYTRGQQQLSIKTTLMKGMHSEEKKMNNEQGVKSIFLPSPRK